MKPAGAGSPAATARGPWIAIVLVAIAVRVAILAISGGQGEMPGLAFRYQDAAYAMAAGFGLIRPAEGAPDSAGALHWVPAEVSLPRWVDSLATRGERLTPASAPRITPSRWRPVLDHPPGYPLYLLGLYRTLGPPVMRYAIAIQIVCDALACLLVFAIARRLAGPRVGLVAAAAVAIFPPIAFLATSQVADAWAPSLFVLCFWLFLRALDGRGWLRWATVGIAFGGLCMMRPDFLAAPVFLGLIAVLISSARPRVLAGSIVMLLAFALTLTPWSLRNHRLLGRFTPGTTAAGMTLLQSVGQFPNAHGVGMMDQWYVDEAHHQGFEGTYDPAADRMFSQRYFEIARRDPALILKAMLRRLAISLAPPYHWGFANRFYEGHTFYDYVQREQLGPSAALMKHPAEILRAYWDRFVFVPISLLLLLASLALAWLGRRDWRTVLVLLAPWLYVVAFHLPLFMTTRMLVPGLFAQLIALAWCIERWRGREAPLAGVGERAGRAAWESGGPPSASRENRVLSSFEHLQGPSNR